MSRHFHCNISLSEISLKTKTEMIRWNAAILFCNKSSRNLLLNAWPRDTVLKFRQKEPTGFGFTMKVAPNNWPLLCFSIFFCKNLTQVVSGFCLGIFISSLYWWQWRGTYLRTGTVSFGSWIQIWWAPCIARLHAGVTQQYWGEKTWLVPSWRL